MSHPDVRTHPMPPAIARLPRDSRGYPIFYTIQNPGGHWSFLAVMPERVVECAKRRLCGICGQPLGYWIHFVGGQSSLESRIFSEPPMHADCIRYATEVCPFLINPNYRRVRERADRPQGTVHHPDGEHMESAAFAIYRTRAYRWFVSKGIPLFKAAPAKEIIHYNRREGQDAGTVDEESAAAEADGQATATRGQSERAAERGPAAQHETAAR